MELKQITQQIIGLSIEVHRELGPGLLESTYEKCLIHELKTSGLECKSQHKIPVRYKGIFIDCGYRIDLLINDKVIVELKCIESIKKIHQAQLLTYMKLANVQVGLLINFNHTRLIEGVKRMKL